ncbi:retinol dehydrogenase 13-like isoform X2 [Liolophura sinensis]|uniref:retinol dehydrogenase 13-like isoform X2 n=1 Tax=Liolophura sinensis TaxID=3198878 RepID=UPI0031589A20
MGYRMPKYAVPCSIAGVLVGGCVLVKDYMGGQMYKSTERIVGKTAIVTGANTGIGKETCRELARRGGRVIMACRDLEKCEKARAEIVLETANRNIQCRHLNLASLASIRTFAKITNERHFLLTMLLLDKLKKSAPSRIINVSSIAHNRGRINFEDLNSAKSYNPSEAYNQSKLANLLFTKELAKRLEGTKVTVNAVHPGIVKTELGRHMSISKSYLSWIFLGPPSWLLMKTPKQGAQTTLFCALDPSLENVSGKYFSDCKEKEVAPEATDPAVAARLWAISEKWTRLT